MKLSIKLSNFFLVLLFLILFFGLIFIIDFKDNKLKEKLNIRENVINLSTLEKSVVNGHSMEPTLKNGEIVYLDRNYTYYTHQDIVAFKLKTNENIFVKRVIAISGDEVIFGRDGFIYLNNKQLNESYLNGPSFVLDSRLSLLLKQLEYYNNIIPEGYVLLLGDNRKNSLDSSEYGLISKDYLIGKVYLSTN